AEQIPRQREEPGQLLFRTLAVDEQPDLPADRGQHRQQVLVRLADLPTEELHDTEQVATMEDGEPEGAVQAHVTGEGRAREVRISHDVEDPRRLAAGPYASGQTHAARERRTTADFGEFVELE